MAAMRGEQDAADRLRTLGDEARLLHAPDHAHHNLHRNQADQVATDHSGKFRIIEKRNEAERNRHDQNGGSNSERGLFEARQGTLLSSRPGRSQDGDCDVRIAASHTITTFQ